jgi:hypothetical protein
VRVPAGRWSAIVIAISSTPGALFTERENDDCDDSYDDDDARVSQLVERLPECSINYRAYGHQVAGSIPAPRTSRPRRAKRLRLVSAIAGDAAWIQTTANKTNHRYPNRYLLPVSRTEESSP